MLTTLVEIFVAFMLRNKEMAELGFNEEEIKKELEILKTCKTETEYFKTLRIGTKVRINRLHKRSIWHTYENAQNHAGFKM